MKNNRSCHYQPSGHSDSFPHQTVSDCSNVARKSVHVVTKARSGHDHSLMVEQPTDIFRQTRFLGKLSSADTNGDNRNIALQCGSKLNSYPIVGIIEATLSIF